MSYQHEARVIPQNTFPRTIYVVPSSKTTGIPASGATGPAGYRTLKPVRTLIRHQPYTLPPVVPKQQVMYRVAPTETRPTPVPTPPDSQRPRKDSITKEDIISEILGEPTGSSGPRRREKLAHLTVEEKMDRRKMKNRMAAQVARDRKKERSQKIEDVMKDLIEENRKLKEENERLQQENEQLRSQQQYRHQSNQYNDETFESAAFINAPLPRVQARRPLATTAWNMLMVISALQMIVNKKKTTCSEKTSKKLRRSFKILRALKTSTLTSSSANCRARLQPLASHLLKTSKQLRRIP